MYKSGETNTSVGAVSSALRNLQEYSFLYNILNTSEFWELLRAK